MECLLENGNKTELYTTLKSNTRCDDVMVGTKWNVYLKTATKQSYMYTTLKSDNCT